MTEQERRLRRSDRLRLGLILALSLAVALPVVVAIAASPDPNASNPPSGAASSAPETKPDASGKTETKTERGQGWGKGRLGDWAKGFADRGFGGGKGFGGFGHGGIAISAISGSKISLKTDDGWARTIDVTADTKITKAGVAATLSDLSVGDKIRLSQQRNDDGTYSITAITIPTQKAGGEVTAVDGNTITVMGRKGETQAIKVNGTTTFRVGSAAGSKADVKVGSRVIAQGDLDGTVFTAISVDVMLTVVGGEVTKAGADAITIKTRDGSEVVVHLSATTQIWTLGKKAGTAADINVGDKVIAAGVARSNGSVDAQKVASGKLRGFKGPKASAAPDA